MSTNPENTSASELLLMSVEERLIAAKIRRNLNLLSGLPEDDMRKSDEDVKRWYVRLFGQEKWDEALQKSQNQPEINDLKDLFQHILKVFEIDRKD